MHLDHFLAVVPRSMWRQVELQCYLKGRYQTVELACLLIKKVQEHRSADTANYRDRFNSF